MPRFGLSVAALSLAMAMAAPLSAAPGPRDLQAEEANRALVVGLYNQIFNERDVENAAKAFSDDYKQHNPMAPDGKAAFVGFISKLLKDNPDMKTRIVRTSAEGDLVWLHSHSTRGPQDRGAAVIDIFRVENGKIVEHWDVIQPVPEKSANTNSMF